MKKSAIGVGSHSVNLLARTNERMYWKELEISIMLQDELNLQIVMKAFDRNLFNTGNHGTIENVAWMKYWETMMWTDNILKNVAILALEMEEKTLILQSKTVTSFQTYVMKYRNCGLSSFNGASELEDTIDTIFTGEACSLAIIPIFLREHWGFMNMRGLVIGCIKQAASVVCGV